MNYAAMVGKFIDEYGLPRRGGVCKRNILKAQKKQETKLRGDIGPATLTAAGTAGTALTLVPGKWLEGLNVISVEKSLYPGNVIAVYRNRHRLLEPRILPVVFCLQKERQGNQF